MMQYEIKNWRAFQHYHTGRGAPPWIRLYRSLLNDPEWFALSDRDARVLTCLWLIAAENEGQLPDAHRLAFRLRTSEAEITEIIGRLGHWVVLASNVLAPCYQRASPDPDPDPDSDTELIFPTSEPRKKEKTAFNGSGKRDSKPKHGQKTKDGKRVWWDRNTSEWTAYLEDYRKARGREPSTAWNGSGAWFNVNGEAV